jgi:thioredoxin reductase (NADPH)
MEETIEFASKPKEGEAWDVAIIGSGPAALTAAIYTTRGAASTLILAGSSWGGQLMLTTNVDNFPGFPQGILGQDLMLNMRRQVERFGAEFIESDVKEVDFSKKPFEISANSSKFLAKSVIIATGADTRWLGVPGEDRLRGKGVSSCAPCDAPFFKDKKVIVVGGGDSAMEESLVLTKYSTTVTIIHRRDKFRASEIMQKKVLSNPKISVIWDTEVDEILGDEKISAVRLKTKLESKQAQETKTSQAKNYQGKILEEKEELLFWEIPTEGLFVAIGHTPATNIFSKVISLDEKGYIKRQQVVGNNCNSATNIPGVFVAGDVQDYVYRQAISAAGAGCIAGLDALRYLDKDTPSW